MNVKDSSIPYNKAMKIGGHLSVAGGYHKALLKTQEIGGNCVQIFSSSPRSWQSIPPSDISIAEFLRLKDELKIDPVYFHASYLINLANSGWGGEQSVKTLIDELKLAEKMKVVGTIIHLGSFKSKDEKPNDEQYSVLFNNISRVLENSPSSTYFIAENAGSRKIGATLDELGYIVKTLQDDRIKICIDTCHAHAAGYDLSTKEKFDNFWEEFDQKIGLERLEVFQVNDSKDALGSFRDRHENIGDGTIPPEVFTFLLTDERTKNKPFILEVPGEDKKGPDKKNVEKLKSLSSYARA